MNGYTINNRIPAVAGIIIVVLALMFVSWPAAYGQNMYQIKQATNIVMQNGVAVNDPSHAMTFLDDFIRADTTRTSGVRMKWMVRQDSLAATVSFPDSAFGMVYCATKSADNELIMLQYTAELWQIRLHEPLTVEFRAKFDTTKQQDIMIGLADTTAVPADSMFDTNVQEGVYFFNKDNDSLWYAISWKDSLSVSDSTKTSKATLTYSDSSTNNTFHTYRITWDGGARLNFLIDGDLVATVTDTSKIPLNRGLAPIVAYNSGAAWAQKFWLDYCYIKYER